MKFFLMISLLILISCMEMTEPDSSEITEEPDPILSDFIEIGEAEIGDFMVNNFQSVKSCSHRIKVKINRDLRDLSFTTEGFVLFFSLIGNEHIVRGDLNDIKKDQEISIYRLTSSSFNTLSNFTVTQVNLSFIDGNRFVSKIFILDEDFNLE